MTTSPYPRSTRWLITAPALYLLLFLAIPTVVVASNGVHFESLLRLFHNSTFQQIAWFTVIQTTLSTVLTVICALPVTFVLSRFSFTGSKFLLALVTTPFLLPTVVVGTSLFALLPASLHYTAAAIIVAHVFFNMAVIVRLVMPRWSQIDPELIHAAHTLGASSLRTFRTITLPLIRPALGYASTAVALFCFTSFGAVRILGGPGYSTLETEIYVRAVLLGDLPNAVALSFVQAVVLISALYIFSRLSRKQSSALTINTSAPAPSGLRQQSLVGIIAIGTALAVISPLIALAWKSTSGWSAVISAETARSLYVSASYAVVAALLATTLGTLLALAATYAQQASRVIELMASLPLMISAVTVGLGILITFDHSPIEFRSSWWITPVAHSLMAIPLVVRIVQPVTQAIPQDLRNAAATLGATPNSQWLTIDLPLIKRAVGTAFAFSAAVSLGEFGATSFLTRRTSETLPVTIARLLSRPGDTQRAEAFALSTLFFIFSISAVYLSEIFRSHRKNHR